MAEGGDLMNLRTRVTMIGGVVGALIGVLAAQLYLRSAEGEPGGEGEADLPALEARDLIKLTLSVLGTLKLVDSLKQPEEQRGRRG